MNSAANGHGSGRREFGSFLKFCVVWSLLEGTGLSSGLTGPRSRCFVKYFC